VYFADDDNAYHIGLFEELRKIKRIGVLPVSCYYHVWAFARQRCTALTVVALLSRLAR
jgi:hypothetical protein